MRIAQLANFYSPTSGGLRVAVDHLAAGYREDGHTTTLVVPGSHNLVRADRVVIASPRLRHSGDYRVIVSRASVLDALDHADPDVIEVHDKLLQRWVWVWAQQRRIPVVAVSHERLEATLRQFVPRLPARVANGIARFVASRVLAESDRVVACSQYSAGEFGAAAKVRIVPLGVDLTRFSPEPSPTLHTSLRLISVGRLSPEKRPDVAIETVRELLRRGIRAELTLLGGGPLERRLRAQAAGLPVRFAGFVRGADSVAARLAASDISLAPGPAETFGLAALESLACGTPVITPNSAATAEFVVGEPAAGRATDLDPVAFSVAVAEMLAIPAAERRLAARRVAERYTWRASVESMLEVHGELVDIRSAV